MRKTPILFVVILLGAAGRVPAVHAQIIGPPIPKHAVELGYMYKWFDRDMEPSPPGDLEWKVATFFGRFGAVSWLTLSLEGRVSEYHDDDFPGLAFRRYSIGGGLTGRVWQRGPWEVTACVHYNEVYDGDRSAAHFNKRTYGVNAGAQVGYRFRVLEQQVNVWAGPMYVRDVGENYPWDADEPLRSESKADLGVAFGGEILLFKHIVGNAHIVQANNPQARIGVALRVGGGE